MRIRELTQRPIVEFAPAWALLDLVFGASPAGQYSDRSPASLVYHGLSGNPKYKDQADSLAKEFNELLNSKGPTDPQVQQIYQNATGKSLFSDHPYLNPMSKPRDGGNPVGMTTAPKQPDPKQTTGKPPINPGMASTAYVTDPKVPNPVTTPKPGFGSGADPKPVDIPKNAPNLVKPGADLQIQKELPAVKNTGQLRDVLGKYTKMPQGSISDLVSKVGKYAIPAAGILALLYGGKKLYDYLTKQKQLNAFVDRSALAKTFGATNIPGKPTTNFIKSPTMPDVDPGVASKAMGSSIPKGTSSTYTPPSSPVSSLFGEEATPGATSAGNVAVVVNPKQAYGHRKRDKNGVPKAPQKTNPDGTAKNALDISNNLMGGETIKR